MSANTSSDTIGRLAGIILIGEVLEDRIVPYCSLDSIDILWPVPRSPDYRENGIGWVEWLDVNPYQVQ